MGGSIVWDRTTGNAAPAVRGDGIVVVLVMKMAYAYRCHAGWMDTMDHSFISTHCIKYYCGCIRYENIH